MGMPYSRASHMKRGTAGCGVIFRRPAAQDSPRLRATPGPARRSLGEAWIPMTPGSQRGRDQTYCGTTWTVHNLGPSAPGVGRAHAAHGHDTNASETKTTRTRSASMRLKARLYLTVAAIGLASLLAAAPARLSAQTAVAIDNDDIGGVVTGASGPEAGVWVIAETTDLPTRYAKM